MDIKLYELNRLSRWELFNLGYDALTYIDKHAQGKPPSFAEKHEALRKVFDIYDVEIAQQRQIFTDDLFEAQRLREYDIRKTYSIIFNYSDYRYDKNKEEAAQALMNIFKHYGTGSSISRMPQNTQTAIIINLLQELNREVAQQHIATLNLTEVVSSLAQSNAYFEKAQRTRLKLEANYVTGVVKSARTDLTNRFLEFVAVVNALAIIEGEEQYVALKQMLSAFVKKYVTKARQRKRKQVEETD